MTYLCIAALLIAYALGAATCYIFRSRKTYGKLILDLRETAEAPMIIKLNDIPDSNKTISLKVEYLEEKKDG